MTFILSGQWNLMIIFRQQVLKTADVLEIGKMIKCKDSSDFADIQIVVARGWG